MTILVVGASGETGRLLVEQLLNRGQKVKAMMRSPGKVSGIYEPQRFDFNFCQCIGSYG